MSRWKYSSGQQKNVSRPAIQQITIDGAIPREIKILPQAGIVRVRMLLGESDGANGLSEVHDKATSILSGADYDAIAAAQATFIDAVLVQLNLVGKLPAGNIS